MINRSVSGSYLFFWISNNNGFDQVTRKKSDFGINDQNSILKKLQSSNVVNKNSNKTKVPTISHRG